MNVRVLHLSRKQPYLTFVSLILIIVVLTISGCSSNNSTNAINVGEDASDGNFAMPNAIKTAVLSTDKISAYITFDNGQDTPQRKSMAIVDNRAEFVGTGLQPGTYTVTIEFEYSDGNFNNIKLTVATKTNVVLSPGVNTNIGFLQNVYDYPDDDEDNVFNIIELELGTDPNDLNDTPKLICSNNSGVIECVPTEFQIGGTVLGLQGTLVLQNNGGDDLTIIEQNGPFLFATALSDGSDYLASVITQPTNPAQNCVIANGSGKLNGADITGIVINCTTNFTVGGTLSGLAGGELVLQLNSANDITIAANGTYSFPTLLTSGTDYVVSIISQPTNLSQTCTLANESNTIGNANVADVDINCVTNTFTVGGTVLGLQGTLVLQNNGGDDLTIIEQNGPFSFATALSDGSDYLASVITQPTNPAQNCVIANGSGKLNGADITGIVINCTTSSFTVGGTLSGLAGGELVLQLNGANDITITANGTYSFPTLFTSGTDYVISIISQPTNLSQTCTLANESNTIGNANVTDVDINCVTNTFTVGGTVLELEGNGLVLQNNNNNGERNNEISVNAGESTFTFGTAQRDGTSYEVSVLTQPRFPNQICTATNSKGKVGGANVINIVVRCVALIPDPIDPLDPLALPEITF